MSNYVNLVWSGVPVVIALVEKNAASTGLYRQEDARAKHGSRFQRTCTMLVEGGSEDEKKGRTARGNRKN